ncbi:hypothetical protein BST83_00860 [Polaribacter filamentus]|uniref:FAS1 domain-containing protein n=1 Tax=Polaribacter filamentus TaxID=53483 RepID=A0A2S7L1Y6_9FLAO|nr:fasciclin domain-containing protein [Polaribacter filamentus]PQB08939.1 hypothetical protein BST83_00860 [Polaribacter filamentus]
MKKLIKFKGVITLLAITMLVFGCDLELNPSYEFDTTQNLEDPFDEITAWEWIQTRTALNDEGNFSGDEMNYFIEAIKAAGMVDEYNQMDTTDRTYLLLSNNAFTGGGDIIQLVTGSRNVPDGETPAETMARANLDKLRTILKYHIVTTYVNQVPVLFQAELDYVFQTLIPGDDGRIAFWRDARYNVTINRNSAPLPSSATSQNERISRYNYIFNNGIGHVINDPVRNKPY